MQLCFVIRLLVPVPPSVRLPIFDCSGETRPAIAQFEREVMLERQRDGSATAPL